MYHLSTNARADANEALLSPSGSLTRVTSTHFLAFAILQPNTSAAPWYRHAQLCQLVSISYQLMAYLWPFRIRRVLQNSFRRELHCWGLRYWVISALGSDALYSEVLCSVISAVTDFCLNPSFLPPSSRESNWWYEFPQEETETVTLSQGY